MQFKLRAALVNSAAMLAAGLAAVTLGWYAPTMYQQWKDNKKNGDFSSHIVDQRLPVTLYGTASCAACIKARALLKAAGVEYSDQNLESSTEAERLYSQLGEERVPILVSRKRLVVGFNPEAYRKLIDEAMQ